MKMYYQYVYFWSDFEEERRLVAMFEAKLSKLCYCIFLAAYKAKGQSQGGAAKETDDSSKETQLKKMPVTDTPSQGRT